MNTFLLYWKQKDFINKGEKLTKVELQLVRSIITEDRERRVISSKTIKKLQTILPKLSEKWKAERVYFTETKREDTEVVADAGEDLGLDKYRIILSPNACTLCRKKSDNGKKIFTQKDVEKSGYGYFVPWHPNCYCLAIPVL